MFCRQQLGDEMGLSEVFILVLIYIGLLSGGDEYDEY